jgi:acetyl-CoA acetyltransferase family protein
MRALVLDAVRTPFGRYGGGLAEIRTDDLGAHPIAALLERNATLDPAAVEDVVLGNTNGAGEDNRNVARMSALLAGMPVSVPAVTINRLCGSGGEAVVQAARAVSSGDASIVIAGGVESMSRAPFVIPRPGTSFPKELELYASTVGWRMVNPRFPDRWTLSLGAAVDLIAAEFGITREEQDDWALQSHRRAAAAWDAGLHDPWVAPVDGIRRDESIRPDTSAERLAMLPPAFSSEGTVTAGNASPINDGAAAMLLASEEATERLGIEPLGQIRGAAAVAVEPDRFAIAPVGAVRRLLDRQGVSFDDVALVEVNEAFAGMVLATLRGLPEVDPERVNPNGGAIAYGHPLGASLTRVVIDTLAELRRRGGGLGVATACIGVGQGIAILCEAEA